MSEKELSTKVSEEDVEIINSIAEEEGREDQPNKKGAEVDEILYGK